MEAPEQALKTALMAATIVLSAAFAMSFFGRKYRLGHEILDNKIPDSDGKCAIGQDGLK